jgi:hypothetical protein
MERPTNFEITEDSWILAHVLFAEIFFGCDI